MATAVFSVPPPDGADTGDCVVHCLASAARLFVPPIALFFLTASASLELYTLSLHDALPISSGPPTISSATSWPLCGGAPATPSRARWWCASRTVRSEEHTSELQSHSDLVCRLLLEKKKVRNDVGDAYGHCSVLSPPPRWRRHR